MSVKLSLEAQGFGIAVERWHRAPRTLADLIEKNLRTIGKVFADKMRRELKPVKYTGETERSVSTEYQASPPWYSITVGPTSKNAKFVRTGSKPHVPPIAPLKRWAAWKLGDANAAYAVQKSIAKQGTSQYLKRKGIGEHVTGHGIGLDFVTRTRNRGDVKLAIERTGQRIGADLAKALGSDT